MEQTPSPQARPAPSPRLQQAFQKRNAAVLFFIVYALVLFCVGLFAFPVAEEALKEDPIGAITGAAGAAFSGHTLQDQLETKGSYFFLLVSGDEFRLVWAEKYPLFRRCRVISDPLILNERTLSFASNDFFEAFTISRDSAGIRAETRGRPSFGLLAIALFGLVAILRLVRGVSTYERIRREEEGDEDEEPPGSDLSFKNMYEQWKTPGDS